MARQVAVETESSHVPTAHPVSGLGPLEILSAHASRMTLGVGLGTARATEVWLWVLFAITEPSSDRATGGHTIEAPSSYNADLGVALATLSLVSRCSSSTCTDRNIIGRNSMGLPQRELFTPTRVTDASRQAHEQPGESSSSRHPVDVEYPVDQPPEHEHEPEHPY
jgi:hypothetical protein